MDDRRREPAWKLWIDTGGTFTDCLAQSPERKFHRIKVLSNGRLRASLTAATDPVTYRMKSAWLGPEDFLTGIQLRPVGQPQATRKVVAHRLEPSRISLDRPLPPFADELLVELLFHEEAPVVAARLATQTPYLQRLPAVEMRLATTKATNALLERKGAPVAFFVTRGFGDLLLIGTQQRPELFDLNIRKPAPFYEQVVEVPERLTSQGRIATPLNVSELLPEIKALRNRGITTAAVALVHSWKNPSHEIALRKCLKAEGFSQISLSHELASEIGLLPRAETSVVNAYLAPIMERYLQTISQSLRHSPLHLMTSAGGLIPVAKFRPKDALLSGPAGGVVGASIKGKTANLERIIAFDMGGTSTDVSRYHEAFNYRFEHRVGQARLLAPALRIETVAAGGGSICGHDSQGLFVGPESAGATPGPACYGAGGPLTLTDVNLLLGRMDPDRFGIPAQLSAAQAALQTVVDRIRGHTASVPKIESLLIGYLRIANERMADAIRNISLLEGYDPARYALVAFGGAGGQHACKIAEILGISTILFPENAGLLSAYGLQFAHLEQFAHTHPFRLLSAIEADIPGLIEKLETEARDKLRSSGVSERELDIRRRIIRLRLSGQEAAEDIEYRQGLAIGEAFRDRYESVFGYRSEGKPIEVVSLHVSAVTRERPLSRPSRRQPVDSVPAPDRQLTPPGLPNGSRVPVFLRHQLQEGHRIKGPAIIQDEYATVYLENDWEAAVQSDLSLQLSLRIPVAAGRSRTTPATPPSHGLVEEELFAHRFRQLVTEMGSQLKRTAISTNIKDRQDYSCALLDAQGKLVANAPHIPVHLGALGYCVRSLIRRQPLEPGDMILTNHPGLGGSHLPDLTVVSPVHDDRQRLIGYVSNRAHHAEIGGIRPGSMPTDAINLAQEGVVIPPIRIFNSGVADWKSIERSLSDAPYPTRALADNLADIRAQAAANLKGVQSLQALAETHGSETVEHHMERLAQRTRQAIETALAHFPDSRISATEHLDDGTPINLEITKTQRRLKLDFTGTARKHPGNFNATPAIVRSAVIYVLRLLINRPLPLNEGLIEPVNLVLPESFLNPAFPDDPRQCPAVVAGNVETSQRLVDILIRAFELAAGSQGTMNNLIFGNSRHSYYETIGGGAGAGPTFEGADGVHTHMTNTGITDPEILETRFPVVLDRFSLRRASGGKGRFRGGAGLIRQMTFSEPVELSLLTQHRTQPPLGLAGGYPGQSGRQYLRLPDGSTQELGSAASLRLDQGTSLVVETPGGGGWGPPES